MKYLITGGAGFIGSHLCETLLTAGHSVTALDNLSTGSTENFRSYISHPNFRFVIGSVEDSHDLGTLMAWADTCFHLAAAVGVNLVVNDPVHTIETNVHGSENIFKYASLTDTKVIYFSTSEVYGKAIRDNFSETDDLLIGPPTHYRWSYAASKALDEYLALAYHKEKKLKPIIVRLFNTVGPRQTGRYGMVLPRFVKQAINNESLKVYGDGEQIRCFCHVADTIRALTALDNFPDAIGNIFNIGTTHAISINDLAKLVIKTTGSSSDIIHIPYSEAYGPGFEDMQRRVPNTNKVNKAVSWTPKKDLITIIKEVKKYIESED